ncbi:unnamed protein product [Rhizoctonia solani]|uniref:Uncharacterized protein n=1 Tax=Rhizoctonia solani TaxID=456999 RepID=A0A8H3ALX4_9AGAM|nr:unnamed protein product [Rhizoctonia solani]
MDFVFPPTSRRPFARCGAHRTPRIGASTIIHWISPTRGLSAPRLWRPLLRLAYLPSDTVPSTPFQHSFASVCDKII